jgi:hypothetical protein
VTGYLASLFLYHGRTVFSVSTCEEPKARMLARRGYLVAASAEYQIAPAGLAAIERQHGTLARVRCETCAGTGDVGFYSVCDDCGGCGRHFADVRAERADALRTLAAYAEVMGLPKSANRLDAAARAHADAAEDVTAVNKALRWTAVEASRLPAGARIAGLFTKACAVVGCGDTLADLLRQMGRAA